MMLAVAVGAFGSLIGSFLNVVVSRVPLGRSVISPPSACGSCGHRIRPYDNIPVVSWLVLRGRCRDCAAPIPIRYPAVEIAAGVAFGVVAWRFLPDLLAAGGPAAAIAAGLELVAFLSLMAISIALAIIDLETGRLPNRIVVPGYVVGGLLLGAAALLADDPTRIGLAAAGAAGLFLFYLAVALVRPGGMGMGDVKLAGVIGLFLGWLGLAEFVVGAVAAFLVGGVAAIVLLARGRSRGSAMPFGPSMLAGAWLGILAGPAIAGAYLSLVGLG